MENAAQHLPNASQQRNSRVGEDCLPSEHTMHRPCRLQIQLRRLTRAKEGRSALQGRDAAAAVNMYGNQRTRRQFTET